MTRTAQRVPFLTGGCLRLGMDMARPFEGSLIGMKLIGDAISGFSS